MSNENMQREHTSGGAHLKPKAGASGGKKALIAVLCVLAVAVLGVGAYLGIQALNPQTQETEPVIESPTDPTSEAPTEPTEAPETTEFTEPTVEIVEPDAYEPSETLLEAIEQNSDVKGILSYGNGTSLFIVQGADNAYYLDHDYLMKSSWTGAPFIDCHNTLEPRDTNLIIHGHNMKNGTMFSNLISFYDKQYMNKFPIFTYATADEMEIYVPYAVVDVDVYEQSPNYFDILKWNFASEQEFNEYVGYYVTNSAYELPVKAEYGDTLLTLSTCNYKGGSTGDGRLLICLRKLRADETVDSIQALFDAN